MDISRNIMAYISLIVKFLKEHYFLCVYVHTHVEVWVHMFVYFCMTIHVCV